MPRDHEVPVLIVGAGPAGLAAALELSRHGIGCLLVERRSRPSSHPRATVLSLRSMELMRAWGLEAAVRARSAPVELRMLIADTLRAAAAGEVVPVGYPGRALSRSVSPTEPACVAQDEVEPLMLERLRDVPGARVVTGHELTGLRTGPDGVRAELLELAGGATRTVRARYAVAADGARSTVRAALGIPLLGVQDVLTGATTLIRAPLWDVVAEHRYLLYALSAGVLLPTGRSDRWLFAPAADTGARVEDHVRRAAGVRSLPVRVEQTRSFSSAAQLAARFRSDRVLLAGDAAHRVTPRGGTGLNLALHDGFDLGWKLAWVISGWAGDELLDTYEQERRPVVAHSVRRSADPEGSVRDPEDELPYDLGGRIAHRWSDGRSTLDLLSTGLTFFAGPGAEPPPPRRNGPPVTVRRLAPEAADAVGAPVLVRPDGRPADVRSAVLAAA